MADRGRHKSESLARMSMVLRELVEKTKKEAQHPVNVTEAQSMEDKFTVSGNEILLEFY